MTETSRSLQAQLDAQPFRRLQWQVVGLCWLVNILDGFDLLAISFAAPTLAKAWQLDPRTLGIVFSSGLLGMTVGSLLLGPAADRIGRRRMIILATAVLGLSTLATAAVTSVLPLILLRGVTGVAIGALLPSLNTLVAEYTPDRRRNLAISFMHLGYPVGGIAGGFLASRLIPSAGWEAVFVVGGLFTLATLPVLLLGLPESLHYLLRQDRPRSRAAADKLAARLGIDLAAAGAQADAVGMSSVREVLRGRWLASGWRCGAAFSRQPDAVFPAQLDPDRAGRSRTAGRAGHSRGNDAESGGGLGMLCLGHMSARWSIYTMMSAFLRSADCSSWPWVRPARPPTCCSRSPSWPAFSHWAA